MEAWIFLKFETEVHKIVIDYQNNFYKDRCIDALARAISAGTRDKTCARAFTTIVHGSLPKIFLWSTFLS